MRTLSSSGATLASKLFGVEEEKLIGALLRPRVKVGVEWVCKGQNQQQVDHPLHTPSFLHHTLFLGWMERWSISEGRLL